MCFAQGPQYSDAGEARTRAPSVLSYRATTLLSCGRIFVIVGPIFAPDD